MYYFYVNFWEFQKIIIKFHYCCATVNKMAAIIEQCQKFPFKTAKGFCSTLYLKVKYFFTLFLLKEVF